MNQTPTIDVARVAAAHDAMAAEYDVLEDLWYPWLFAAVHEFLAESLEGLATADRPRALDVGCGTGLQSFLLARAGFAVEGVDVSDALLAVARTKIQRHAVVPMDAPPLFVAPDEPWLRTHDRALAAVLERTRGHRAVVPPTFRREDIRETPLQERSLDLISCCGSVLSFIDDYPAVLEKLARALHPRGRLVLEVEQRFNLDLLWPVADLLLSGRLGYEQSWRRTVRNLLPPWRRPVRIDYPFELRGGEEVVLPILLFSTAELEAIFARVGLQVHRRRAIHCVTNLFPSTFLHGATCRSRGRSAVELLRRCDRALGAVHPFSRLGCSVIYELRART